MQFRPVKLETADLLGLSHATISRVYSDWLKKRNYRVSNSSLSINALFINLHIQLV